MWNIIGHKRQLELLQSDIKNSNLHTAYLFTGPSKIGKMTIAKNIAKILQCDDEQCKKHIDKNTHIDTFIYKDNGKSFKIEDIKDIISKVEMTFNSKYLIFIIENIERFTQEASNAFLKTLEEPGKNVVFILTAENENLILDTIKSRVSIINFYPISNDIIANYIKNNFPNTENDKIDNILNLSLGRIGLAIDMLENQDLYLYYKNIYNQISLLEKQNLKTKINMIADNFFKNKKQLSDIETIDRNQKIDDFIDILLRYYFIKLKVDIINNMNFQYHEQLENIKNAKTMLETNTNKKIILNNLMLNL